MQPCKKKTKPTWQSRKTLLAKKLASPPPATKEVEWDIAGQLIAAGATGKQVASYFGMHPDTFYKKVQAQFCISFTEYQQEHKERGDAMLILAQFEKAVIEKDKALLIWLGKQRLNQKEPAPASAQGEQSEQLKAFISQVKELSGVKQDALGQFLVKAEGVELQVEI
jgi:AraC-like DNA-binding protein